MSRLSKKSDIEIKEFLVDKLEDLITNDKTTTRDLIKSIELVGREYGLFIERKQINVDIQSVVRQLTDDQLGVLVKGSGVSPYIDVQHRLASSSAECPPDTDSNAANTDPGTPESGPKDESSVDSGRIEEN